MKTSIALIQAVSLVGLLTSAVAQQAPAEPQVKKAPAAAPDLAVPAPIPAPDAAPDPAVPAADGEKGLRLNFRGVPLDMVLNYLSDAAGFIIVLDTEVKGKVDVWSNQPPRSAPDEPCAWSAATKRGPRTSR